MSFAGKNLKYLRKSKNWTQEEFATKLNIKRSLVGAYEEERAEPRLDVLETVCALFKLSFEDFLLKDLAAEEHNGLSYLDKRRALKQAAASTVIQFVPVKAAAGYLAGFADPDFIDELNTFTLPMLAPGYYRAFEIVGDSMLPTPSGSVIVGERVESFDDVKNSNTYIVVSRNEGIVYKRIVRNTRVKQKLTLVSDNPQYEPYTVDVNDIMEVWKAQMILTRATHQQRWDVNSLAGMVNSLQEQVSNLTKKMA
jgi:transcriptional regulator with XRE-family HTH domain